MPTYVHECEECFDVFEIRTSMSEYAKARKPKCPRCGSKNTVRAFASINVITRSRAVDTRPGGGCCPGGKCL